MVENRKRLGPTVIALLFAQKELRAPLMAKYYVQKLFVTHVAILRAI